MPQIQIAERTFDVRRTAPADMVDLRWRILRTGLPREEAIFPGDGLPTSIHVAAIEAGQAVCCATFHLNEWQSEPAYQLRGMATDENARGMGLGRAVLELAEREVLAGTPIRQLWCNARTPAVPFYLKQGWEVRSDVFHIPTAGPHRRMTKWIGK